MNADEIARTFYQRMKTTDRPDGGFLTAKQTAWLDGQWQREADRERRKGTYIPRNAEPRGIFTLDGQDYGWELHPTRTGAGSFKVHAVVAPAAPVTDPAVVLLQRAIDEGIGLYDEATRRFIARHWTDISARMAAGAKLTEAVDAELDKLYEMTQE